MLNSVNQIRVELQEIANAHLQINDFFWGDFLRAYKENTELNYVLMGCFYPTATMLNNQTQLTLTIYICDRVYKDYSNLNDVESDTLQICRDVYNVINSSFRWKRIGKVQGATCQKFIERGGDEVAGHTLTIQFLLRDKSGICDLPMQDYDFDQPVPTPGDCNPAQLTILDTALNTLYSLSLLSGSTNNQTIQDATWALNNTNASPLLTGSILAEGSDVIVAPDAQVKIKHSQGGTIATLPAPSGVTTLYVVADSNIEVNGTYEFSIHATHTYDIRLKDESNNTITPTSITPSANHADIVINTAAPVGAIYIVDTYSPLGAFALFKLSSTATNCIRIRRSSDNAETDIGFDVNGNLDTKSIYQFVGINSAYVTTYYDQSGNGKHRRQTTAGAQPIIVENGVISTMMGKPSIKKTSTRFFNSSNTVAEQMNFTTNQRIDSFAVIQQAPNSFVLYYDQVSTAFFNMVGQSGSGSSNFTGSGSVGTHYKNGASVVIANRGNTYTELATATPLIYTQINYVNTTQTITGLDIGGYPSFEMQGFESVWLVFNTDQSANRVAIETLINDYYGIY